MADTTTTPTPASIMRQALEEIMRGATATGRWVSQLHYDAIETGTGDSEKGDVPPGYYDTEEPPEEDDLEAEQYPDFPEDVTGDARDELLCVDGKWLRPAMWEAYSKEEQDEWLESVADIARRALDAAAKAEDPARIALAAVLPLAESRAEDLSEIQKETEEDDNFTSEQAAEAAADAAQAWASVERARQLLA